MTGLTAKYVARVCELTIPSLESLVRWQYRDMWAAEFDAIDAWRQTHGVTCVFDINSGELTFAPGVHTDIEFGHGHIILVYT